MYTVKGSIWIETEEGAFIGSGRVALLEGIQKYGSITVAAKAMKMSYRQAWELVDSMNKQSPQPLVRTTSGGHGGGGTIVTKEGRQVITLFKRINERFYKFNEQETKKLKI